MSDQCTCTKDSEVTCIVHPTERSLKKRIAELEKTLEEVKLTDNILFDILKEEKTELEADRKRLEWFLEDCVFDEIDGIDVHILACTIADQDGRDEPTDADYLIAYRQCIDEAMNNE